MIWMKQTICNLHSYPIYLVQYILHMTPVYTSYSAENRSKPFQGILIWNRYIEFSSAYIFHVYEQKRNWHGFQMSISCLVFVTSRRIRCSYIFYYRSRRKPLEMHNNLPQLHWVLLANISICYWRCRPMLFHTKSIPSQKLNNLIKREKEIYMLWLIFDSIPQHTDIIQPIRYWTVYI